MNIMNDIDVILSIPVSPVYINALILFNSKSLPTFVNHTILITYTDATREVRFKFWFGLMLNVPDNSYDVGTVKSPNHTFLSWASYQYI